MLCLIIFVILITILFDNFHVARGKSMLSVVGVKNIEITSMSGEMSEYKCFFFSHLQCYEMLNFEKVHVADLLFSVFFSFTGNLYQGF